MKIKNYSLLGKLVIVLLSYGLCVLAWLGKLPNATTMDIWSAGAMAYCLLLGTIDFNIVADNILEKRPVHIAEPAPEEVR